MRAAVWNARSALLYSLGGWTLLGALLHHTQSSARREGEGGDGATGTGSEPEGDAAPSAGPPTEVFTTNVPIGLQITTVVTYLEKPETPLARLAYRLRTYFRPEARAPPGGEAPEAGNSVADRGPSS